MEPRMKLMIVSALTIILPFFPGVSGLWENLYFPFKATGGKQCISQCEQRGETYFWCYTDKLWGGWDYCSPVEGVDIYGKQCEDECALRNSSKLWCNLVKGKWERCGQVIPETKEASEGLQLFTSTDPLIYCLTPCETNGDEYNWCRTARRNRKNGYDYSWDYCSDAPGYDAYGQKCKNKCGLHGHSSLNCETDKSLNSPCGYIYVRNFVEYTSRGTKCVTPCACVDTNSAWERIWSNPVNKCFDLSWNDNYCSTLPGLDTSEFICSSHCDSKGGKENGTMYSYDWCTVLAPNSFMGWGYCSAEEGTFNTSGLRAIPQENLQGGQVFRQIDNLATNETTFFEEAENNTIAPDASYGEKEGCKERINTWLNFPVILSVSGTHPIFSRTNAVTLHQEGGPFQLNMTTYVKLKCVVENEGLGSEQRRFIAYVTFPTAFLHMSDNYPFITFGFAYSALNGKKVHIGTYYN